MFFASSNMQVGKVLMSTRFAVGQNARVYVAERRGMSADTSLFPATQVPPRPVTLLWIFLSGTVQFERDGKVENFETPCAFSMPEHWSEGADGRRSAVRILTAGEPYTSVQVHYRKACEDVVAHVLSPEHAREIVTHHRRVLDAEAADSVGLLRAMMWKLVSRGLLPGVAVSDSNPGLYNDAGTLRMWEALQRRYTALDPSPSIKAMAEEAGISLRKANDIMKTIFEDCLMPPGGFREATINVRLSLASILLSKSALGVADVAQMVGYQQPEALANAFRHAGLPSPATIKKTYSTSELTFG